MHGGLKALRCLHRAAEAYSSFLRSHSALHPAQLPEHPPPLFFCVSRNQTTAHTAMNSAPIRILLMRFKTIPSS